MRKKRRSSRKRKSGAGLGDFLGILGAIVVLLALIGAGIYLAFSTEKQYALDEDLCPDKGARATYAVLLDTTDQLAPVTKAAVTKRIFDTLNNLPRFYRLSIYTMDENGLNEKPLRSVCNPGRTEQMGELESRGFTANPEMIERKFSKFKEAIEDAVEKVFREDFEASQSPLLGSMQELVMELPKPIATDKDKKHPAGDKFRAGRNRIIYVTDLMEHTKIFSIYRSGMNIGAFVKSRATEKFRADYTNTQLEFWIVRREISGIKTQNLWNFWEKFLSQEFRAKVSRVEIMSGEI